LGREGERTKKKEDPAEAAKKMQLNFRNRPELWLKPQKILSFFSRTTAQLRKRNAMQNQEEQRAAIDEVTTAAAQPPPDEELYQPPHEDQLDHLTMEEQIREQVLEDKDQFKEP
jgi:hypothetical protein